MTLVVYNASSHKDIKGMRGPVDLIPLPPNVTALHQPMAMAVIYVFKRLCQKAMLLELVRDIESRDERLEANRKNPSGMNEIAEGSVTRLFKAS